MWRKLCEDVAVVGDCVPRVRCHSGGMTNEMGAVRSVASSAVDDASDACAGVMADAGGGDAGVVVLCYCGYVMRIC